MVPLCASCGETVSAGARCPRCDAPPPAWRPKPRSAGAIVFGVIGTLMGLSAVLFAVMLFASRWESLPQGVALCALGALGAALGVALIRGSVLSLLLERDWTHPIDGGRTAHAVTQASRVLRAWGGGEVREPPMAVPANALRGVEAFAHYGVLRRLAASYGAPGVARVDVALAAALLSLAARRAVELRVACVVSWRCDGGPLSRSEALRGVEVRRVDGASFPEGLVERALFDALTPPLTTVVAEARQLPYRAPAASAGEVIEAPWTALPQVVFAMTRGRATARRELRARMESQLASAAGLRSADEASAELAATLDGLGERAIATRILRDIRLGFDLRAPTV